MRKLLPSLLLLLLMGGFSSIVTAAGAGAELGSVFAGEYELVKIFDQGKEVKLPENLTKVPNLKVEDNRVSGHAGVNRFSGNFEVLEKGMLGKVGPFMMTRMAGPPELMKLESDFSGALEKAKSYKVLKDNKVELANDKGEVVLLLQMKKVEVIPQEKLPE